MSESTRADAGSIEREVEEEKKQWLLFALGFFSSIRMTAVSAVSAVVAVAVFVVELMLLLFSLLN